MTFNPTIPQPNDLLSNSQADLLTNFSTSNGIFGLDHVNFDNSLPILATLGYLTIPADEGKHTIIHAKMIDTTAAPPPAPLVPLTSTNEGAIYTSLLEVGGRAELMYRYDNNGSVIQLSGGGSSAWCYFDGTSGGIAPPAFNFSITNGYNVDDITKNAPGDYTINFTTALQNIIYAVFVRGNTAANVPRDVAVITRNLANCRIRFTLVAGVEPTDVSFQVIGG